MNQGSRRTDWKALNYDRLPRSYLFIRSSDAIGDQENVKLIE